MEDDLDEVMHKLELSTASLIVADTKRNESCDGNWIHVVHLNTFHLIVGNNKLQNLHLHCHTLEKTQCS